jgi:antitoxin (DNA-binding transcriptional repressor) of toxin-antitoxin stability system
MSEVTVTQVARNFAEYVNRVAYRRESFTLVRGRKPLAELRPLPTGARLSELPGLLASLPRLSATEAGAFAEDLEASRSELGEVRDAWQS